MLNPEIYSTGPRGELTASWKANKKKESNPRSRKKSERTFGKKSPVRRPVIYLHGDSKASLKGAQTWRRCHWGEKQRDLRKSAIFISSRRLCIFAAACIALRHRPIRYELCFSPSISCDLIFSPPSGRLLKPVIASVSIAKLNFISIWVYWHWTILDRKVISFFLPSYSRAESNLWEEVELNPGFFALQATNLSGRSYHWKSSSSNLTSMYP